MRAFIVSASAVIPDQNPEYLYWDDESGARSDAMIRAKTENRDFYVHEATFTPTFAVHVEIAYTTEVLP